MKVTKSIAGTTVASLEAIEGFATNVNDLMALGNVTIQTAIRQALLDAERETMEQIESAGITRQELDQLVNNHYAKFRRHSAEEPKKISLK